jgi:endonuclease/exonuclease/phosphatase family metal-dependent hydrolase
MVNRQKYEKMSKAEGRRLKKLRKIIDKNIPSARIDENLLIATFNIREFGAKKREGFAINALAEICSCFDIIAIQELRSNLNDLKRVLNVMGPYWKVIFNDPAGKPKNKGNDERFAFIYDSRVVRFTGMAAELLVTDEFLKTGGKASGQPITWRTPYMASFRAGFFDFVLLTVHIQWNQSGGIKMRRQEIDRVVRWVSERREDAKLYDPDIFVLGDFNIPSTGSSTYKALLKYGLIVPSKLVNIKTNLKQNATYDQIAYYEDNKRCEIIKAGTLNFFEAFFSKRMSKSRYDDMTFELSDHLPLWMEVNLKPTGLDQFIRQ